MRCPLCGTRKARRYCPGIGQTICAVCCGTKRLTEIACPADCPYLASAREHPAAVVRRQQEKDVAVLLPSLQSLTERQMQLFFVLQGLIVRHRPEGFSKLIDADVAEATAAVAATLETAARGVIYEHTTTSPPAQRLAGEIKRLLAEIREKGATVYDGEAAIVLRAIERGARDTGRLAEGGDTAYLTLISRMLRQPGGAGEPTPAAPAGGPTLIVP